MSSWTAQARASRRTAARWLAALMVGLLVGSLLTVSSLASAANTAVEGNIAEGERRIAGATRYDTAVNVAELAIEAGARVPTEVLIASGENFAEAVSATALSAERAAPILLTHPDRLPAVVRGFIGKYEIERVTILGGPEAVKPEVAADLTALGSVTQVNRLWGADRYETAAAIANVLEVPGNFCDTAGPAIILVNGESRVDGVTASPASYAMRVPVLFSYRTELHPDVRDYLQSADIEQVVLVGSEAELDDTLVGNLQDEGVDVTRITGPNVYARSVAFAQRLATCESIILATNHFALLHAEVPVDGVTASGLLADGAGLEAVTGEVVPVLLVSRQLPAEVRDFLRSIPARRGSVYQNVTLHALGGIVRITPELMRTALSAAITSSQLTSRISARAGENTFTVTFSAPVDAESATTKGNYEIIGQKLLTDDRVELNGVVATIRLDGYTLRAGDRITVADGTIRGAGDDEQADLRRAAGATFTVPGPTRDRIRPRVSIIAPPGAPQAFVHVTEANPSGATDPGEATTISDGLNAGELAVTVGRETLEVDARATEPNPAGIHVARITPNFYAIYWGCADTDLSSPSADLTALCTGTALSPGDRVHIEAGAIVDASGNTNRSASFTVRAEADNIELQGSPTLTVPTVGLHRLGRETNGSATIEVAGEPLVHLAVHPRSRYAGAASANWLVQLDYQADAGTENDDPEVDVTVHTRRGVINITIDDDAAVPDLVAALKANSVLTDDFAVTQLATEPIHLDSPIGPSGFDGGPIVATFADGLHASLLTLRFGDPTRSFDLDEFLAGQPASSRLGTTPGNVHSATFAPDQQFPAYEVRIIYTYSAPPLPGTRESINLPAAVATNSNTPGTNEARTGIAVRTIAGVRLNLDVEPGAPIPPIAGPVDRSTLQGILNEAADRRNQNAYELQLGYHGETVGLNPATGVLTGLHGFTVDTSSCPAGWNTMGVTGSEIRLGLSVSQTETSGESTTKLPTDQFAQGWLDYLNWVNENDPVMVGNRKLTFTAIVHDDTNVRAKAVTEVGKMIDNGNFLSITSYHPDATADVTEKVNANCVPHVFNGRRHSDVGNPENNPWTTGLDNTWFTEGYMMGERIGAFFSGDTKPKIYVFVDGDDAAMVNVREGFEHWLDENPQEIPVGFGVLEGRNKGNQVASIIRDTLYQSGTNALLIMATGDACQAAVDGLNVQGRPLVALRTGLVQAAQLCTEPHTDWSTLTSAGSQDLQTAFRDTFKPIDTADAADPFVTHARSRFRALTGRSSSNDMNYFGYGYAHAYPVVEAVRIAAQLPGGVTRANFMLAVRSLDLYHPLLPDGVEFELAGTDDPFPIEGGWYWAYDGTAKVWENPQSLDVNGDTPTCDPNSRTGACQ